MKRKILRICILLLAFFVLVAYDLYAKSNDKESYVSLVQFKAAYEKNHFLTREDLSVVEWPQKYYQESMVLEHEFEEGYLKENVYKEAFLHKASVKQTATTPLKNGQRLITLKCSIVESNGWQGDIDSLVDLVMVGQEETYVIENAKIYKQFDDVLSTEGLPQYYMVVVDDHQAMAYYQRVNKSDVFVVIK